MVKNLRVVRRYIKKWSEGVKRQFIGEVEAKRIAQMLMQRHAAFLAEDEWFEVQGYHSDHEVYTCVTLRNADESMVYPVECRIDLESSPISGPVAAQDLLLDFQDYYFGRYLEEDRDLYLTIDWGNVVFDESVLQSKGQILNLKLEHLADQFLAGEISAEEVRLHARPKTKPN